MKHHTRHPWILDQTTDHETMHCTTHLALKVMEERRGLAIAQFLVQLLLEHHLTRLWQVRYNPFSRSLAQTLRSWIWMKKAPSAFTTHAAPEVANTQVPPSATYSFPGVDFTS
jgi:hypothetical protein